VVTGLITVAAALSYGELAGMMPNAGGQFVYIQRAYGRSVSLYGWTVLPVIQTGDCCNSRTLQVRHIFSFG
jgi:APA family basic amino acid/polyamine antiporter